MKDIAIIGIAGRFPDAKNIEQLYQNLKNGKDSANPLSKERLRATTMPVNKKYKVYSWLEDIDKFDHKFFNISLAEAQNMDPHQRLALEVVYEAFESSGYSIDHFFGSNTSVYCGDVNLKYWELAEKFDPTLLTGNINAATAGRISRFFNLRGNSMMIDTNCSSTLVATHLACNELRAGDADYSIICGARLIIKPEEDHGNDNLGIMTQDGKTKSFSAAADGTGAGEAIASILLKPLDKALADNDIIYAIIKGSAVNQEAQLSGSLTAPSSTAQSEVIKNAWQKANVEPLSISYIEPHGSGTKLGDPIEIQGIDLAYKNITDKKHFVSVSALKSNIGHTDTVAGLSGLIKTVISLQNKELFPSLHFDEPNPFIDFDNSVTYINTELKKWETEPNVPRRAGISSFGISGTNCHLILEEAPQLPISEKEIPQKHLVCVSSKTTKGLLANLNQLKIALTENQHAIEDVSHTLNRGRKHYNFRFSAIVTNIEQLITEIDNFQHQFDTNLKTPKELKKLFFIFSDSTITEKKLIENLCSNYPLFKANFEKCVSISPSNENVATFAYQYSYYFLLESLGIKTTNVLGIGIGRLVIDCILGNKTLEEAIKTAENHTPEPISDLEKRLMALIERETAKEKVAFLEIGTNSTLIKELAEINIKDKDARYQLFSTSDNEDTIVLHLIKNLYTASFAINFEKAHSKEWGRKIKLPAYQFEPIRCWLKEAKDEDEVNESATQLNTPIRSLPTIDSTNFDASQVEINKDWTPTEQKIARFWVEVLKLDEVNIDDDFFKLGGHSLIATQLISRIEKEYGVKVAFKDVSVFSTIKSLANGVEQLVKIQGNSSKKLALVKTEKRAYYPLSAAQKRLWIMDKIEGGGTTYNLPGAMYLEGEINKQNFEKAFYKLIERHESLRTSFVVNNEEPVQIINDSVDFKITYSKLNESEIENHVQNFIKPFNLANAPLLRVELVQISNSKQLLLLDIHHIISDGVSAGVILNDFIQLYQNQELNPLPIQYKDFSVWQDEYFKSTEFKNQENYWLDKFSVEIPVLNIITDFQRPAIQSFEGDRISFEIGNDITKNIYQLCRDKGVTVYMAMLAAYNVLLHKYTGQDDIVIGSVIAGRTQTEVEALIGMFVNTLAMRNFPNAEKSFAEFLEEVKNTALEAYSNQDYPFEMLVDKLSLKRDMGRNPLFDTLITYQNFYKQDQTITEKELAIKPFPFENKTSKFDITLEITEGIDSLKLQIEYSTKLFKKETIERLFIHFSNLLKSITDNPEIQLKAISLLSDQELETVLHKNNHTATNFNLETNVIELFENICKQFLTNNAIHYNGVNTSYHTVSDLSGKLSAELNLKGIRKGDAVAVLMHSSTEMYIAIWAILKAGGIYVPIDPTYPKERIKYMLQTANCKLILCHNQTQEIASFQTPILNLSDLKSIEKNQIYTAHILPSDSAYIIFTSGSTGNPKGVEVSHKALVNLCIWYNSVSATSPTDNTLKYAGNGFDASIMEIFGPTLAGACTFIVPSDIRLDLPKLNKFMEDNRVSIAFLPTPIAEQFFEYSNPSLRILHIGGDKLNTFPKTNYRVFNDYGPTENTVVSTYFEVDKYYENIPIGKPINNVKTYILDKNKNLQPIGIPGELYISGESLAKGYINHDDLTFERFIKNPFEPSKLMYQTGDLCRWLPDGNIEFLGRIDNQVKIRGFRIEIGEIEKTISSFPEIQQVVVTDFKDNENKSYLAAYFVSKTEINDAELKNHILSYLPEYMLPSYLLQIELIPITANGKVDKKALPKPEKNNINNFVLPQTEVETHLTNIWSDLLGIEKVSTTDNFFEIGGHSLKATQLVSRIHQKFNVEIPLREVFKAPTIQMLAQLIKNSTQSVFTSITIAPQKDKYGLSAAQRRLYILHQLNPDSTAYNIPGFIKIYGKIDKNKLSESINSIIDRHESFRTKFVSEDDKIYQKIEPKADFKVEFVNETDAESIIAKFVKPFNLEKDQLLRVCLLSISNKEHILMFDMHHIISDGTSMSILVSELSNLYNGFELEPLKIQYKDYAEWQNQLFDSENFRKQKDFWLSNITASAPILDMPTDFSRPKIISKEGKRISYKLSETQTNNIQNIGKQLDCTEFMTLLSVFNILLSKYSSQEDIIVGSPIAGRHHTDLENIVGMFINTLAIRNYPEANKYFDEFLFEVKENALKVFENQDYPFDELVDNLTLNRDTSRNPIFDVMFIYQNTDSTNKQTEIGDWKIEPFQFENNVSKFDITFEVSKIENQFSINLEYSTALFKEETIVRFLNHFSTVIDAIANNTKIKIKDISLISETEKSNLLATFAGNKKKYNLDNNIVILFENMATQCANDIIIEFENEKYSYQTLNKEANKIANYLIKKGIKPNQTVSVLMKRSFRTVATLLGILKSGAAYVAIDPKYPENRINYILHDSQSKILFVDNSSNITATSDLIVLQIDAPEIQNESIKNPTITINTNDLAYIIYTSGSTGNPKGVAIEHKNLTTFINWCNDEYSTSNFDIVYAGTSFSFDLSIFEIFYSLQARKKIRLLDSALEIADYLATDQNILLNTVPSVIAELLNTKANFSNVTVLNMAGEPIPYSTKQNLDYNKIEIRNLYGPSEDTTYSTYYKINELSNKQIIGKPLTNTDILILDKANNLCPIGIPGELCITGDGVARGYLFKEDLTNEKFIKSPLNGDKMYKTGDLAKWNTDGNIEYLGRIDYQVKIRGFRIELGEIETQLMLHPAIEEVVVIDKELKSGEKMLCAYYIEKNEVEINDLKNFLKSSLPSFMIPTYFIEIEKIPLTPNGKIDKKAFPAFEETQLASEIIAPSTETEKKLFEIWKEALKTNNFGITNSFFELGGNSLRATFLVGKIAKELGVKIQLKYIFEYTTIQQLANFIENASINKYKEIDKAPNLTSYPLSSVQRRLFVLQEFDGSEVTYNLPMAMNIIGTIDKKRFNGAFKQLINRHESLRTKFEIKDNNFIQRIEPTTDFEVEFTNCTETEAEKIANSFIKPFKLNNPPLLKVILLSISAKNHLLLIDMHHIISDGTSTEIMIKEFIDLYQGKTLPLPTLQYKDYAFWQNQPEQQLTLTETSNYWKKKLSGEIPVLNFPTDYVRPAIQDFSGDHINVVINKENTQLIKQLASKTDSTLYIVLLTAYNILLHKYTQQKDFIVGSPVAGRLHPDLNEIIGPFANTVVIRNKVETSHSVAELIKEVKTNVLEAMDRQDYPFEELLKILNIERDISRNPLFDTIFAYQNFEKADVTTKNNEFEISSYQFEYNISKFDFSLIIEGEEELKLGLEYANSLFKRNTMEVFLENYINILNFIVKNPNKSISEIDFISADEKKKLLIDFNNNFCQWPSDSTTVELIENIVAKYPHKIALIFGDKKLTYSGLNAKSNQFAWYLRELGIKPDDRVGLILDRNIDIYVALLGVLKAGGAYVPLDSKNPWDRNKYILEDSQASIVITQNHLLNTIKFSGKVIDMDNELSYSSKTGNLPHINKTTDLAYIIYTSGSTGKPKGVMIEHQNLVSFAMNFEKEYSIDVKNDIMLSLTRISFDMSNTEHIAAMINGMTMALTTTEESNNPEELAEIIRKTGANVMQFTPSRLTLMFGAVGDSFLDNVKVLLVGAEPLPTALNKKLCTYKHIKIYNVYGPSEATTWSTGTLIEENRITIGVPHLNERIYVLNNELQLVPIGVAGEICVAGPGVGRGYTNEEISRQKFIENPFVKGERMYRTGDVGKLWPDGHLEFVGRSDFQVKIRGFRIELGEIESAILENKLIKEAVVVLKEKGEIKDLVAYLVCSEELNIEKLNEELSKTLPDYMVPSFYVKLDKMPLNDNGKLDRKQLPEPQGNVLNTKEYIKPNTSIQTQITSIWQEVLGVENISINDTFFAIGGNSLKAVAIIAKLREVFENEIPFTVIFNYPTIEQMAEYFESKNNNSDAIMLMNLKQEKNIFAFPPAIGYSIAYSELAEKIISYSFYGFNFIEDSNRINLYADSIEKIQPTGSYLLFGYSAGGNLAFHVAKELSKRGKEVDIILIDVYKRTKATLITEEEKLKYAEMYISDNPDHISNQYLTSEKMKNDAKQKIASYYEYLNKTIEKGKINGNIYFIYSETKNKTDKGREKWNTSGKEIMLYNGKGEHALMFDENNFNYNFNLINSILKENMMK